MDIELLKTFLEVHKTRHFGKAAENLYITSAAVSARIKQLEQLVGVSLFVRTRGNVQLTNEGERLLPHAETLVLTWHRTLQELALEPSKSTRIHMGATFGLWQRPLLERLMTLTRSMPELAIQAEGHSGTELVRKLEDRTLDLVLLNDPPRARWFKSEKIGHLKLVLAATDKQATIRSCMHEGYVYIDWGSSFAVFHAARFGESAPASLHVNLLAIATGYLAANGGAAYLPQSLLAETSFLHEVEAAPGYSRPIYATYREGSDKPELIGRVIELLQDLLI